MLSSICLLVSPSLIPSANLSLASSAFLFEKLPLRSVFIFASNSSIDSNVCFAPTFAKNSFALFPAVLAESPAFIKASVIFAII